MTYDESGTKRRCVCVYAILACALCLLAVVSLCTGSVEVAPFDVMRILLSGSDTSTQGQVIWDIRLPRVCAAVLLGAALALSGFLLQTFFNNPIADPFILGVSSGAKLAVALAMIVVVGASGVMTSWMLVACAFAGSLLTMGFVLIIARRVNTMSMLIVAGVMVGYLCSAVTNFLIAFADDASIVNLHNWSQGSFSGITWSDCSIAATVVLVCGLATFALSKPLGAYQLGEVYAQSMGVSLRRFRVIVVALSSLLVACVTAFAGPVSFVGIAVPHLVKTALKTSKPRRVIPAVALAGALFCVGCDLIARTMFAPTELSVSAVTAVFGAPVVIAIMLRKRSA